MAQKPADIAPALKTRSKTTTQDRQESNQQPPAITHAARLDSPSPNQEF